MLRLERDAWSTAKLLRQATNEYPPLPPPPSHSSLFPEHPSHFVVVVFGLTHIIKSVVTGHAPVTPEWKIILGEKTQTNQKGYKYISQRKQFMHPPKSIKISPGFSSRSFPDPLPAAIVDKLVERCSLRHR